MNCPTCSAPLSASAPTACPACGADLAPWRALLTATAALPRECTPARDLWPEISAQLPAVAATPAAEPPLRPSAKIRFAPFAALIPLAVAASLALLLTVAERRNATAFPRPAWAVSALAGTPRLDSTALSASGRFLRGQWLVTDATARARVTVGTIGEVTLEPNSRLRLVATAPTDHRLELARGTLSATISAPPRIFFVNTPSATAVDLGCAYFLTVDETGAGELLVTGGFVALEDRGRESIVPSQFLCLTRRDAGPGTPFAVAAPAALRAALERFDFPASSAPRPSVTEILSHTRATDAVTLWHLLARVAPAERATVFDALAAHHAPPAGVTRAGILSGDATMRRTWATELGLGTFPTR